jgi:hypothetical protein
MLFNPPPVGPHVDGVVGDVTLPLSEDQTRQLIERARQALFAASRPIAERCAPALAEQQQREQLRVWGSPDFRIWLQFTTKRP